MANLIIAYDLDKPGQNYTGVHAAIKALGRWYQLQFSLFYVKTELTAEQAYSAVWAVMDQNDKLMVADAVRMVFGNYSDTDIAAINTAWTAAA